MRVLVGLAALVLTGCELPEPVEIPPPEYMRAQREYTCTAAQFERVAVESKFCDENTDTFSSACFGHAIIRNCAKIGAAP